MLLHTRVVTKYYKVCRIKYERYLVRNVANYISIRFGSVRRFDQPLGHTSILSSYRIRFVNVPSETTFLPMLYALRITYLSKFGYLADGRVKKLVTERKERIVAGT
jgi:hypothetical protein